MAVSVVTLKCWRCGKLLAEMVSAPFAIVCPRCHARNCD